MPVHSMTKSGLSYNVGLRRSSVWAINAATSAFRDAFVFSRYGRDCRNSCLILRLKHARGELDREMINHLTTVAKLVPLCRENIAAK